MQVDHAEERIVVILQPTHWGDGAQGITEVKRVRRAARRRRSGGTRGAHTPDLSRGASPSTTSGHHAAMVNTGGVRTFSVWLYAQSDTRGSWQPVLTATPVLDVPKRWGEACQQLVDTCFEVFAPPTMATQRRSVPRSVFVLGGAGRPRTPARRTGLETSHNGKFVKWLSRSSSNDGAGTHPVAPAGGWTRWSPVSSK